jgi:hypothetical protein
LRPGTIPNRMGSTAADGNLVSALLDKSGDDDYTSQSNRAFGEGTFSELASSVASVNISDRESNAEARDPSVSKVQSRPLRASLPSSWYTSENFFALETRAIFSQVIYPLFGRG